MYNAQNIRWVKSVKRNSGSDWAYEELNCANNDSETPQKLHWRTDVGQTAASHPRIGDVILLFQTLSHGPHRGVRLTHLVSPISEEVLLDSANIAYQWYREVRLIAKAEPIHAIPKPEVLHFNRVGNGGLTFGIDLLSNDNIDTIAVQNLVWNLFSGFFCSDILPPFFNDPNTTDFDGQVEGNTEIRQHIQMEIRLRNSRIIYEKKQDGFRRGNGRLICECCDFDFVKAYGQFAEGFIECHHKIFLSEGERITRLEDLALVCSNCHRMLHQKNFANEYYSPDELRNLIESKR